MRLLPHGAKIGNATVIVDIVETNNREIRPRTPMKARAITDHDTGNSGKGADAQAHNRLLHNWGRLPVKDTNHICWHLTVDEKYIYQHIPFDEAAYHCGDGFGINSGNRTSIGIEKCMHQGSNREVIETNSIALTAYLMKHLNIPISTVYPHQKWSNKYCPQLILNKYGSFRPYRNKIEAAYKGNTNEVTQVSNTFYRIGDRGDGVRKLQGDYNKVGYRLVVDGIFGNATDAATRNFQRKHGLVVDGIAGKNTLAKLAELTKPKPAPAPKPNPEPKPVESIYRVIVEGKQVGAYGDHTNIEFQVAAALKSGKKKIVIEQV